MIVKYIISWILLLGALYVPSVGAATYTVANLNNSGAGSLRDAITQANSTADIDIINFGISGTIVLSSALPSIVSGSGELTIDGTGQSITVSGNNAYLVFRVEAGATLNMNKLRVTQGAGDFGGGLYNMGTATVSNSEFSGNMANYGAGIASSGTATVSNSTFSGNTAAWWGGGFTNSGTVTISNSTFSGNTANGGGGLYNQSSAMTVSNSTFSGNIATARGGGGFFNYGAATIKNSTFSSNTATSGAGGGIRVEGTASIANTIIANSSSSGGDCYNDNSLTFTGINLVGDGTCSPRNGTDLFGSSGSPINPFLGALADNGGPTKTMALLTGSPAIDAGDNTVCAAQPINNLDQRGATRPKGPNCDIGAYEISQPLGLLNDTGQTRCFDGTAMAACSSLNSGDGSANPGQDGRFGRDPAAGNPGLSGLSKPAGSGGNGGFAFTPLDASGNAISLTGSPPAPSATPRCILDNVTNLIWEVKTDDNGLQDKDWTYGWVGNTTGTCYGSQSPAGCSADNYVTALNAVTPAVCPVSGAGAWRLPTRRELLSIIDHDRTGPAIDAGFFANTQSWFYWSGDGFPINPSQAWVVYFGDGRASAYSRTDSNYVRLVRTAP